MNHIFRRDFLQSMLAIAPIMTMAAIPAVEKYSHPKLKWLSPDGDQFMFPLYGTSGSLTSTVVSVLIDKPLFDGSDFGRHGLHERNGGRWYVIEFSAGDSSEQAEAKILEAQRVLLG